MPDGGLSSVGRGGPGRLLREAVTGKLSIRETSTLCVLRKEVHRGVPRAQTLSMQCSRTSGLSAFYFPEGRSPSFLVLGSPGSFSQRDPRHSGLFPSNPSIKEGTRET